MTFTSAISRTTGFLLLILPGALVADAQILPPIGGTSSPFMGGVPSGVASPDTLPITVSDAVQRALDHNLGALEFEADITHAEGTRWKALSDLLPHVGARVGEVRQVVNLETFGLKVPGFPTLIGPFNVFDARIFLSQSVFDLNVINTHRADSARADAARYSYRSARDLVVLVTANLYLQALAAAARADSSRVQVETARALYEQAQNLKEGGIIAGIDVIRAEVRLSTERQRATATENEREKAKLQVARVMGLPIGQRFDLVESVPFSPAPELNAADALERAYAARPDYQAALARVRAAEAARRAAAGEAVPSVHLNADYGATGQTVGSSLPTYRIAGEVSVPLFQGGRVHGAILEADADLRRRQAEADDLRASVYYEIQTALLDITATSEQLQVATRTRELSQLELTQARDRFAAGVASNLEVVQAQQSVALASEQVIDSLYRFNISKVVLARALGEGETALPRYLGGIK